MFNQFSYNVAAGTHACTNMVCQLTNTCMHKHGMSALVASALHIAFLHKQIECGFNAHSASNDNIRMCMLHINIVSDIDGWAQKHGVCLVRC